MTECVKRKIILQQKVKPLTESLRVSKAGPLHWRQQEQRNEEGRKVLNEELRVENTAAGGKIIWGYFRSRRDKNELWSLKRAQIHVAWRPQCSVATGDEHTHTLLYKWKCKLSIRAVPPFCYKKINSRLLTMCPRYVFGQSESHRGGKFKPQTLTS